MPPMSGLDVDRRAALKAIGAATLAMSTTACSGPRDEIVPYARMPERLVPGSPLFFATTTTLNGFAQSLIVETHEGRPTKVEGNPDHPWSRGAADAFAQAQIWALYDPARSRTVTLGGRIDTFDGLRHEIETRRPVWAANRGSGLRLLTNTVTSPSLADTIGVLRRTYPGMHWHRWQPINLDHARAGTERSFGRRLDVCPSFDQARLVVAIDADPLGPGPNQVANARGFANGRRARRGSIGLTRMYAVEPTMTLTGAAADRRLALSRMDCGRFAAALAARLGGPPSQDPPGTTDMLEKLVAELAAFHGAAMVLVGDAQPAAVHAFGHWINSRIGALDALVAFVEPPEIDPVSHAESLQALIADAKAGQVDTLIILGGNPGLDAPSDVGFAAAIRHIPLTIRHGLHEDETSSLCRWHVPALHAFEAWGDARTPDGRTSLAQPLVSPLYGGYDAYAMVQAIAGGDVRSDHDVVQDYWRRYSGAKDFDSWWRTTLHDGIVQETLASIVAAQPRMPDPLPKAIASNGFEIAFSADPSVWDGAFADNAWLQETPHPFGKHVWGNAVAIAAADAARLSIVNGNLLRIVSVGVEVVAPAWIAPGQALGTLGLSLGQGRRTGAIARGVGYDGYALRTMATLWSRDAEVQRTDATRPLTITQADHDMHGRDIVRTLPLTALGSMRKAVREPATLYPSTPAQGPIENAYAMVIDQSVCIGCNACLVACRSENNVPVVGPEQISVGRDMAWLRVDAYEVESGVAFQPVPCMHCEKAPCEPVCPVGASVHDSDGLNVQVYNRCVGTRFCQANCPYGVRRFNFFGYADGQEYANTGEPILQALRNPDVSVRARGVMEKCTYCVQRISSARKTAEKEERPIRDGEVVTACQQTCPVQAICFGDLKDQTSVVSTLRQEPHEYGLLAELGTRPRTTYLARIRDEGKPV